jgi:hypothetical protein
MVPESHELTFSAPPELKEYLRTTDFQVDIVGQMRSRHCLEVRQVQTNNWDPPADLADPECLILNYTRNNAGGLKDAIDFLIATLVAKGLDAATVRGAIPRPKSDSFEESLPYFDSKLIQGTKPHTDSPTRSNFGDVDGDAPGFFSKFRKPGSMSSFTSLIDRRKNGTGSPGSLFKHASSNASKASLASLESQGSSYRNPWNDSGINLPDEDGTPHANGIWPVQPSLHGMSHANSSKMSFGAPHAISPFPHLNPGDTTPTSRYDPRASVDSGRPSTSHSFNNTGYPGPIGSR